ncbi:MAG: SynChlorMet cassette protein ScmC [bacterium]
MESLGRELFKNIDSVHSYSLVLADGQKWELTSSKQYSRLLSQIASVLQLKKRRFGPYPKIVFTGNISGIEKRYLQADEWLGQKIGDRLIIWSREGTDDHLFELTENNDDPINIDLVINSTFPIYLKALAKGGLPFHAGLIVKDGLGFILPACGGIGKSTCCARVPAPWVAPADDEVLVVRAGDNDYQAHPFPTWSNFTVGREKQSWKTQESYPLKAILFLERAKEDLLIPLGPGAASGRIYQSAEQAFRRCLKDLDNKKKLATKHQLFENSCALAKQIPAYVFKVSLKGQFWDCLEGIIEAQAVQAV